MDKKQIIAEFVEGTIEWHEECFPERRSAPCLMCGVIPDNLLELAKELTN